jgi:hypothetical protein
MYDPRWDDDQRSPDDSGRDLSRGSRGGSDPRERERPDPRDVFMDHVDLPRGLVREHVHHHDHDYALRGSETRTLTSVGAFRVARADDLRDTFDKPLDPRHGELWHLRESGLVHTVRIDRETTVVALTKEGRDLPLPGNRQRITTRRHHEQTRTSDQNCCPTLHAADHTAASAVRPHKTSRENEGNNHRRVASFIARRE